MGRLADALKDSSFIVTGELTPPKGTDLDDLFDKAAWPWPQWRSVTC